MYYCEMKKKKKKFFFFQSCRSRTHLCDTRPPNVWKRFCFFSLQKVVFLFSPPHFCCCPLFWVSRSTPSSQKATVHCAALTKQLFGHFYFSCIFHAWVFIAKNKLREIKSRNFKSSLVNYLRENSTTATENQNPSTFFISPVKENPVRPVLFH
jgi:hypothetical protein